MASDDPQAEALYVHLRTGVTTTCRCWLLERRDGWSQGFTDHDENVAFAGKVFSASSGVTASALESTTGLAVNNTEAAGALSAAGLTEADIEAGRFDAASITFWLVNWTDPEERVIRFRGTLGEVTRKDETFSVELRGMTEPLNQARGRLFQRDCSAVLGDGKCGFNTASAGYHAELAVLQATQSRVLRIAETTGKTGGWFTRGRLTVLDGAAAGLTGWIKGDVVQGTEREITLWQGLRAKIGAGDRIRIEAGCDKQAATCAAKFGNFANFRGCPHIPGDDMLTSYPRRGGNYDGGSLNAPIVS